MITEYEVTYSVKEWLLQNDWDVVAFNPPGSQGTFTIPNPEKDPDFRGQTGSVSPDIIAIKDGEVLIVECKPGQSDSDESKVLSMVEPGPRFDILRTLIYAVANANNVRISESVKYRVALANGDEKSTASKVEHFRVEKIKDFNPERIRAGTNVSSHFRVTLSGKLT